MDSIFSEPATVVVHRVAGRGCNIHGHPVGAKSAIPRTLLLLLPVVVIGCLAARQGVAQEFSRDQLVEQLRAAPATADDDDVPSRSLSRKGGLKSVKAPGSDRVCTADSGAQGADAPHDKRNLKVVPRAPDGSPQVDLHLGFSYASFELSAEDRGQLDVLAGALNSEALKDVRFTISGHTDASGDDDVNRKLSCARANAVYGYLVDHGVAAGRMTSYGFGSDQPVSGKVVSDAINRRVEVRRAL